MKDFTVIEAAPHESASENKVKGKLDLEMTALRLTRDFTPHKSDMNLKSKNIPASSSKLGGGD